MLTILIIENLYISFCNFHVVLNISKFNNIKRILTQHPSTVATNETKENCTDCRSVRVRGVIKKNYKNHQKKTLMI